MAGESSGWHTFQVEGFEILVGKGARENDQLTFKVGKPQDLWLHAAGYAGSHVLIRNPERRPQIPKEVVERAAEMAVYHSKAREARGKIEVHVCKIADVRKPPGWPAGKVELRRWESVKVYPKPPPA